MRTALIHYWLVTMRGGEKVLQELSGMFPEAPIFTHTFDRASLSEQLSGKDIRTTFIQKLPQASRRYQQYLPLMPLALEGMDFRPYDLIISSESGPAKGVIAGPGTTHICYCHSPMRYIWDMYPDYLARAPFLTRLLMRPLCHYLRIWDASSSTRVDQYIANSNYVSERIKKFYGRTSVVVPPPVNVGDFSVCSDKEDFYLFFGELVNYKRADIAVEAFRENGKRLIVAGKGEQLAELKKSAPANITFTGSLPFSEVKRLLAKAKALVFPGIEDFGIVPVEAMASGTPVIAFNKGGILDSVIPGKTGVFFREQSAASLNQAILEFENNCRFDVSDLRQQAEFFTPEKFRSRVSTVIQSAMEARGAAKQKIEG